MPTSQDFHGDHVTNLAKNNHSKKETSFSFSEQQEKKKTYFSLFFVLRCHRVQFFTSFWERADQAEVRQRVPHVAISRLMLRDWDNHEQQILFDTSSLLD